MPPRRPAALAGLLLVAALAAGCVGRITDSPAPVDQAAPGRWIPLTPLPSPRQEVAVAPWDGRVWVIGGFGEDAEPVAAVGGDRLFVVGGYSGGRVRWQTLDSVWEFVAARQAWEARAPMPTPRGALAVVALGGRLHALGGASDQVSNAHEVYDPATNRWTRANPMPTARDHLAAVAFQGRVWALGGRSSFMGDQYGNVEIYDPATDSWRTGTPLPAARGGLAAVALADRILVFGGEAPLRIFSANEMYEVAGNRWIAKEPMPTARHGIGAAVIDGRVYVPGGATQPGFAATAANEAYLP
jgi:N-acetylneuraminic acid mutarotase